MCPVVFCAGFVCIVWGWIRQRQRVARVMTSRAAGFCVTDIKIPMKFAPCCVLSMQTRHTAGA